MTALTPEALDALSALLDAATPGPWEAHHDCGDSDVWKVDLDGQAHVLARRIADADAALIAALVNATPALIAAARDAQIAQGYIALDPPANRTDNGVAEGGGVG